MGFPLGWGDKIPEAPGSIIFEFYLLKEIKNIQQEGECNDA
jgi:hypothetical protein